MLTVSISCGEESVIPRIAPDLNEGTCVALVPVPMVTRGVTVGRGVVLATVLVFGVGVRVGVGVAVGWIQEPFVDALVGFCVHHDESVGFVFAQESDPTESEYVKVSTTVPVGLIRRTVSPSLFMSDEVNSTTA